jgi:hypothetical protein
MKKRGQVIYSIGLVILLITFILIGTLFFRNMIF